MNRLSSSQQSWRRSAGLVATAAAIYAVSLACVCAADPTPEKQAQSEKKIEKKSSKETKYSGADLYAMHCSRCHPERYATERTATQWKTLMLHMRVRANLPAVQAKSVLKYLQEDSGK